ncbi:MAG: MotA/TolQ/ExbB proton channel family protein [Porticoccaceae bacterium]
MYAVYELWEHVRDFMDQGGVVLYAIAVLLLLMWTLIFERLWYLKVSVRKDVDDALRAWADRSERQSKKAGQVREMLISRASEKIDQSMPMINALVALAPLFGLLGTVTGMISVFEIMAITGGGDAKSMSSGVSKATIPTMSGMVAAISGVFGYAYLERMTKREKQLLADHLTMDH